MSVLAIDPGTSCGWAVYTNGVIRSGTWDLRGGRHEGGGMRFLRLERQIIELFGLLAHDPVSEVYYEEVRRHLGTDAAHIYGGIVATVTKLCEEKRIPYSGQPVSTVKKFATGKGNADKKAMMEAAQARFPDQYIRDDNQADALWILATALNLKPNQPVLGGVG